MDTVSETIVADSDVMRRNNEFLNRYVKWGHTFDPQKFPVTVVDGVITYRWRVTPSPTSSSFMGRYLD